MIQSGPALFAFSLSSAALGGVLGWWWGRRRCAAQVATEPCSHDPVTGLPNRPAVVAALHSQLSLAARIQRPLTLLLLEVDGLEGQGPERAQAWVHALAPRWTQRMRVHDLLGHWSAHRLLAILPDTDVANALVLAEDLRQIAAQDLGGASAPRCSVSVAVHGRTPSRSQAWPELAQAMLDALERALAQTADGGPGRIAIEP